MSPPSAPHAWGDGERSVRCGSCRIPAQHPCPLPACPVASPPARAGCCQCSGAVPVSTGAVFVPVPHRELCREHGLAKSQHPAQGAAWDWGEQGVSRSEVAGWAGEQHLETGQWHRLTPPKPWAILVRLLAAEGDTKARGEGLRGSSLISGGVWYTPVYLQISPGGHQDSVPSP